VKLDVDALEAIAKAARPGPWQWYGNTKMHEVYLATVHDGRHLVMDFARYGMSGAQPRFQMPPGFMRSVGDLGRDEDLFGPKFDVPYRRHFTGIGHPDATHIAANDPTTTLALIARIRELEAALLGEAEGWEAEGYGAQHLRDFVAKGVTP
jgi:hypothetical protein